MCEHGGARILVCAANSQQLRSLMAGVVPSRLTHTQGVVINYASDLDKVRGNRYDAVLGLHLIKSELAEQVRAYCLR